MSDYADSDCTSNSSAESFTATDPTAEDIIVKGLQPLLTDSAYACGGTVSVEDDAGDKAEGFVLPITIRWDTANLIRKLVLPVSTVQTSAGVARSTIQDLVDSTQPASFGFEGKDVVDESYRKACKLDPSAFSTNFCPYVAGIIDTIGQTLLPLPEWTSQGLRAELYKLNIYEAPSGMFKPHLDTPRSELHIGSLVVCLPHAHEGGELVVRHQGHSTTFDWSKDSENIQWAAFYGDCEHEVAQVTSGHRITLTYNLFLRVGLGEMAGHSEVLDSTQLPVYKDVKAILDNPEFFPNGGYLAKYCSHAYAHATDWGINTLPRILKGSDMVTYEVFRSLGIEIQLRPTLDYGNNEYWNYLPKSYRKHTRFGKELSQPLFNQYGGGEDSSKEEVYEEYPSEKLSVTWLNEPTKDTENMQYAFMVYGNQAELSWTYSHCVILMVILPHSERMASTEKQPSTTEASTET